MLTFSRRAAVVIAGAALTASVLTGCGNSNRDADGNVTEAYDAQLDDIQVGDCFNEEEVGFGSFETLPLLPCGDEHTAEIYAASPESDLSGEGSADDKIESFCSTEFESFVGVPYEESELELTIFEPFMSEGGEEGDIHCVVISPEPVTETLEGSNK